MTPAKADTAPPRIADDNSNGQPLRAGYVSRTLSFLFGAELARRVAALRLARKGGAA